MILLILILIPPKLTNFYPEKSIFLMKNIPFIARRWLEQPGLDDRGLGRQAIALVVEDGLKIATVLPGNCNRKHTHTHTLQLVI